MRILLSIVSEGQQSLKRREKLMKPNFKSHHEETILSEIFYVQKQEKIITITHLKQEEWEETT